MAQTVRSCDYCQKALPEGSRIDKRHCGPACRVGSRQRRRAEALDLFLAGSQLRASGSWDPETVAAIDREAARLLGVDL